MIVLMLAIAGCGGNGTPASDTRTPAGGGGGDPVVAGGGGGAAVDASTLDAGADPPADLALASDLSSPPDLSPAPRLGTGAACTSSCQCDATQHLVCHLGHCRDGTLANAGHPVTQAFGCCEDVVAAGLCTDQVGCQSPSGAIGPCAGACADVTCSTQFDCGNAGCAGGCDPNTHRCS